MDLAAAETALMEWSMAGNAIAFLRAVHTHGGFDALREPATADEYATRTSIEPSHALHICMALEALQIVAHDGDRYRLTDGWATVSAPDRPVALGDRLAVATPLQQALAGCFAQPSEFGEVDPDEAVALACSVWGVAKSPVALESWGGLDDAMPEVRDVWRAGALVGYDLLPHVLEHARRLAADCGVSDRVELRCEDVLAAQVEDAFETIVWSHMFFSGLDRAAAVASILRALKPGGYLIMPFMADLPAVDAVQPTTSVRTQLLIAVAYRRWNIQWPQGTELQAEMEGYGFIHLHTIPHPRTPFMVMRTSK
jgi:hypothetical protein